MATISIVVPAHNEAENLPILKEQILEFGGPDVEIIFVDDGSTDSTFEVMKIMAADDARVKFIHLSRNFGHQPALRAGLAYATGDCVISMDADLQHPPRLIPILVGKWHDGYEVVGTLRQDPASVSPFKRITSSMFYRIINAISDVRIEPGSADFRLLDKKAVAAINTLPETDFFLRGIIPWIGFRTCNIKYTPDERRHGVTKYRFSKMVSFAITGVIANSLQPLRAATFIGGTLGGLAILYALYAVCLLLFSGRAVPGWASIVVAICIVGALQLFMLGIVGEYIGRILREARRRPPYIVSETNISRA